MATLLVFDPAMCCSTGVCGPQVDPALVKFASDMNWLKGKGVTVQRYNLGQNHLEFAAHANVIQELNQDENVLPILIVDGEIISRHSYPTRAELAKAVGVEAPAPAMALTMQNA